MNNTDTILISDIESSLKKENTFEENIKVAMKTAKNHWLVTDKSAQFGGAVGALGVFYGQGSEEFERLKQEMKVINTLSTPNGVPVDFISMVNSLDSDIKPCDLRKIWDES